jgi:predicted RNA-binding protein YlqC (UPF0109 family)
VSDQVGGTLGTEGLEAADQELGQEELDEEADNAGNRVAGALPRAVLDYLARSIVDDPEGVVVEAEESGRHVTLRLHVAPDDMGKVIGRRGRVAQAIRTLVKVAGAREGLDATVDIVDA